MKSSFFANVTCSTEGRAKLTLHDVYHARARGLEIRLPIWHHHLDPLKCRVPGCYNRRYLVFETLSYEDFCSRRCWRKMTQTQTQTDMTFGC